MNQYHPIIIILLEKFGITEEILSPLHEQLLANREDINGLKEMLTKHEVVSEIIFQNYKTFMECFYVIIKII